MSNKKTKIILDAGTDTALFIEASTPADRALMIPVSESAIIQKMMKRKIFVNTFKALMTVVWLSSFFLMKNSVANSGLQETTQNIVYFVFLGIAIFGSILLYKSLSNVFDTPDEKLLVEYAREEIRKNKYTGTSTEEYYIKSSYLYSGTDGDFITWYKQEKNKKSSIRKS